MNYIEQIRGFWRSHEEHLFSTTEIAVYFYLLEVCNICHWKNPFKRNNAKIGADLGISFNTLKNARNRLKQAGLIEFKTTNGSPDVVYTLSNFDKVTCEVDNEVTNEVACEVSNEVLSSKIKLNETKQEKEKTPKGVKKKERVTTVFIKPTLEEVRAYCSARNKGVDAVKFYSHYESNGWKIGRTSMKNWKAAIVTWERNSTNYAGKEAIQQEGRRVKPEYM